MRFLSLLAPILFLAAACVDSNRVEIEPTADDAVPSATRTASTPRAAIATPTVPSGAASGPHEHVGANTVAHIQKLAGDIGERVSGTSGEREAADYIAAQFRASGYDVETMEFEFEDNPFRGGSVKLNGASLNALVMSGSAAGNVSARTVYVGLADETGIAGKDLKGAIAVADRGTLNFSVKYTNVKNAGAVGLIVINNEPGLFPGNLTRIAEIPVVGVAGEERERLRTIANSGATVSIEVGARSKGLNVIARPAANATCDIIVGGHHDTVPAAPGATDNASGTATVLELARAFATDGLDRGLCFATFGGEESGLHGSRALAQKLDDANSLPRYMVNLDVTATGKVIELIGDRELQTRAKTMADNMGFDSRTTGEAPNTSSDHASFREAGVPVIFFAGDDYSMIHTPNDNVSVVNAKLVEDIGDLAFAFIGELLARVARG